jgi:hypothetical protein
MIQRNGLVLLACMRTGRIYISLFLGRTLALLQARFECILIGVASAETSIPLRSIQRDALARMRILVLRIKVTNLGALGGLVEGKQCLGFVAQDKQSDVQAILSEGEGIWGKGSQSKEGGGEFHGKQKGQTDGGDTMTMFERARVQILVLDRDIRERHTHSVETWMCAAHQDFTPTQYT